MEYIKRNYPAEFRADENTGLIEGIPIVFDTPTDIGGWFEETIVKGAISNDIIKDVRFFWNHNIDEKAIARTLIPIEKLGGMELHIAEDCVKMLANPNRKRTDANDLYLAIEDGVINAMSFMFGVAEERWEDEETDYPKRFITRIDPLIEVSAVNFPAYATTSINARKDAFTENDRNCLERARQMRKASQESEARKDLELLKAKLLYLC
ncbi:MAG: HK97 family phage prohead protease [Clostridia bacterium]|nr:HK97 family phage prohead protease [Clostridia bacterium]